MPPTPRIPVRIDQPLRSAAQSRWTVGGKAFVDLTVVLGEKRWFGGFLVDTGASRTTIGASEALEFLGDEYFLLDFDRDPLRVDIGGIGGLVRCVVRGVELIFRTEAGPAHHITAPILIPEMTDAPLGRLPMHTPSLLGRDLLGAGALTLAYRLPTELHFSNMPTGISL